MKKALAMVPSCIGGTELSSPPRITRKIAGSIAVSVVAAPAGLQYCRRTGRARCVSSDHLACARHSKALDPRAARLGRMPDKRRSSWRGYRTGYRIGGLRGRLPCTPCRYATRLRYAPRARIIAEGGVSPQCAGALSPASLPSESITSLISRRISATSTLLRPLPPLPASARPTASARAASRPCE